ncbi:hypothetical protein EVG20_g4467 [Dentipellis fragilis]|uniref:Uncharacterized protein n=1 Tax=Dentipellis fragilis TaxID=205917 RepID=A0A4Y9YW25_9AGAM|nr:hypothetical protein EVG20_g4467 [Dentipellis fragilis]
MSDHGQDEDVQRMSLRSMNHPWYPTPTALSDKPDRASESHPISRLPTSGRLPAATEDFCLQAGHPASAEDFRSGRRRACTAHTYLLAESTSPGRTSTAAPLTTPAASSVPRSPCPKFRLQPTPAPALPLHARMLAIRTTQSAQHSVPSGGAILDSPAHALDPATCSVPAIFARALWRLAPSARICVPASLSAATPAMGRPDGEPPSPEVDTGHWTLDTGY